MIKDGVFDAVQCTRCGQITEAHHTPLVMQTNFKGIPNLFLKSGQADELKLEELFRKC
ncbi:hypothetical protein NBRC111894_3545 [Sporolactobacillus inulinus]|uniref:Uncharacterized protein n=1 Tax=Sporolactobacillus inulinus TaxID=2078 RepID=A0A4Y1ZGA1_9BACL|nr:hypothetical protein [Sporolactobacillus inulinus]GAY77991.1 hypothetical protein NBRC111894_3545 [Sporolactobacillus inulinus]